MDTFFSDEPTYLSTLVKCKTISKIQNEAKIILLMNWNEISIEVEKANGTESTLRWFQTN